MNRFLLLSLFLLLFSSFDYAYFPTIPDLSIRLSTVLGVSPGAVITNRCTKDTTFEINIASKENTCTNNGKPANCKLEIVIDVQIQHSIDKFDTLNNQYCVFLTGISDTQKLSDIRLRCTNEGQTGGNFNPPGDLPYRDAANPQHNQNSYAIFVKNAKNIDIKDCDFYGSGPVIPTQYNPSAISAWTSVIRVERSEDVKITNPKIHNLRLFASGYDVIGIDVRNSKNVQILKDGGSSIPQIQNIAGTGVYGIILFNTEKFLVSGTSFYDQPFRIKNLQAVTNLVGIGVVTDETLGIYTHYSEGEVTLSELSNFYIQASNLRAFRIADVDLPQTSYGSVVDFHHNTIKDMTYVSSKYLQPDFSRDPNCVNTFNYWPACFIDPSDLKPDGTPQTRRCFQQVNCLTYGIALGSGIPVLGSEYKARYNDIFNLYSPDSAIAITGGGTINYNTIDHVGSLKGKAYGIAAAGEFVGNTIKNIVSNGSREGGVSQAEGLSISLCTSSSVASGNTIENVAARDVAVGFRISSNGQCSVSNQNDITNVYAADRLAPDGSESMAVGAYMDDLNGGISSFQVSKISGRTAVGLGIKRTAATGKTTGYFPGADPLYVHDIGVAGSFSFDFPSYPDSAGVDVNFDPYNQNKYTYTLPYKTRKAYGFTLGFPAPFNIEAVNVDFTDAHIDIDNVKCTTTAHPDESMDKAVGLGFYGSLGNTIKGNIINDLTITNVICNKGLGVRGVELLGSEQNIFSGIIGASNGPISSTTKKSFGVYLKDSKNNEFTNFKIQSISGPVDNAYAVYLDSGAGGYSNLPSNLYHSFRTHDGLIGYDNVFRSDYNQPIKSSITSTGNTKSFFVSEKSFNSIVDIDFDRNSVVFGNGADTGKPPNHRLSVKQYADFEIRDFQKDASGQNPLVTSGPVKFSILPKIASDNQDWSWINTAFASIRDYGYPYLIFGPTTTGKITTDDTHNYEVDVYWYARKLRSPDFTPHLFKTEQVPQTPIAYWEIPLPTGVIIPNGWPDDDTTDTVYYNNSDPASERLSTRFQSKNSPYSYLNRLTGNVNPVVLLLYHYFCGDGIVQTFLGEECDDGNNANGDGCSSTCIIEPVCGDGDKEGTEDCDSCDYSLQTCKDSWKDTGTCYPPGTANQCKFTSCGDNIIQNPNGFGVPEECSDEGLVCPAGKTCNGCVCEDIPAACGDGNIDSPSEDCDYGLRPWNSDQQKDCLYNCKFTKCGDGLKQNLNHFGIPETCDPCRYSPGILCWNVVSCIPPGSAGECTEPTQLYCGDGTVTSPGEDCDTANGNDDCTDLIKPFCDSSCRCVPPRYGLELSCLNATIVGQSQEALIKLWSNVTGDLLCKPKGDFTFSLFKLDPSGGESPVTGFSDDFKSCDIIDCAIAPTDPLCGVSGKHAYKITELKDKANYRLDVIYNGQDGYAKSSCKFFVTEQSQAPDVNVLLVLAVGVVAAFAVRFKKKKG